MEKDKRQSKWRCECCDNIFFDNEYLTETSPFREDDILVACPKCRMNDGFEELCDIDGCNNRATCGTPTKNGCFDSEAYSKGMFESDDYIRTCYEHIPKDTSK